MNRNADCSPMKEILKIITTGDKILIVLILLLGGFSLVALNHFRQPGYSVTIEVNGKVVHRLDLNRSIEVSIQGLIGTTTVKIDHRAARVIHSDCPEQICVKTGKIHLAGEMIVCVPNKVIVRINGDRNNQFDVITQ